MGAPGDDGVRIGSNVRIGQSNFGALALLLAAAITVPMLMSDYLPRFGFRLPQRMEENLGVIVFDFGILLDLLILVLASVGITQGGRNRWFGVGAILLAALPWLLPLMI
jgi:hypothetical protein